MAEPGKRVAPVIVAERWQRPGRPPEEALPAVQDAYRQTGFQLGGDLRLVDEGMNQYLNVVRDSSGSATRSHPLAAALLHGSRAFLALADAVTATVYASYSSVPSLVRQACEGIAASHQAHTEEQQTYQDWLAGALTPNDTWKATEVTLGAFFAGSTLAAEPDLGSVYRAASEFARPHFGVALTLVAPESNGQRVAVTFGDRAFHYGWAQIQLGWTLQLLAAQFRLAQTPGAPYVINEERVASSAAWAEQVQRLLSQPDRCRIEGEADDGGRRWLISGFRRQAGGAPRRLLL